MSRPYTLAYADYRAKVLAGWLGKSLGGVVGAPYENQTMYHALPADAWPAKIAPNDDFDIQVVWLEALQERGLYLTGTDLAEYWQDRCTYNFCEYGHFLRNLQRGLTPPLTGDFDNSFFRESEGCPIRSEIWAFVAPGNPELAAALAQVDAELDHAGLSIAAERFNAAAAAQAFVTTSLDEALAAGRAVVPADSPIATAVDEVRRIARRFPDHLQAWRTVLRAYGDRDASKALTNHALVLLSLFHGGGDVERTIRLAVASGWDTDCTAATAAALLGVLHGPAAMPTAWVQRLGPNLCCAIPVRHRTAPLAAFTDETCLLGVEMAAARNPRIQLTGAPTVVVRPPPPARPTLTASYPAGPALWRERATTVHLTPQPAPAATDRLTVQTPAGVQATVAPLAGGVWTLTIARTTPTAPLPDRNLFRATWIDAVGTPRATQTFGLVGARQWLVYGPYWDMWDTRRASECPYFNATRHCLPHESGQWGDIYNLYARLDRPYLDEARLLREELWAEAPLLVEQPEDRLRGSDFGGFNGQACYYFVRTFAAPAPGPVLVMIPRSGPCQVWLDGQPLLSDDRQRGFSGLDDPAVPVTLTGRPQRLVIKLVQEAGDVSVALQVLAQRAEQVQLAGADVFPKITSWLVDCLADHVPAGGPAALP